MKRVNKNGVNEYLASVVAAAGLGVVSDIICTSYGKSSKGTEKFVKLAVTLCMLAFIVLPCVRTADYRALFDSFYASGANAVINEADRLYTLEYECEKKVSEYIFEKTGIKPAKVIIDMKADGETFSIVKAEAVIKTEDKESGEAVCFAATEALGVKVNVTYEK